MDSKNGGQYLADSQKQSSDMQRKTAAEIARKKVLAAYGNPANPENIASTGNTMSAADTADVANVNMANVNSGAAGSVANNNIAKSDAHLKDQPMMTRITSESWKKYHSAWQDYYQRYYSQYYAQAARNYVEKERLKDARKQAEEEDVLKSLGKRGAKADSAGAGNFGAGANNVVKNTTVMKQDSDSEIEDIGAKLKQTIRKKATENVKQSRRRRRWIPVVAGLLVVLLVLFLQYNRLIFAPLFAYVSPGNAPASEIEAIDPTITQAVSADPRLIIPKLNVDVPIHFGLQLSEVMSAMNNGVAHYRIAGASAYPGEIGNTVITGHSAGDVYSSNPYKYIFSGLERLDEGDLIYVNYESVRYTYQVKRKEVVEPTNVAALVIDTDRPMLTLVTCTPLGTSRYRLLVFAEQISPSFEGADEAEDTVIDVENDADSGESMPSNEATFFEGIWQFLTGGN